MTAMFFVENHIHAGRDRGEERHGADFALADMLGKHDWKGWARGVRPKRSGLVMSGWRPLIKGYFAVAR